MKRRTEPQVLAERDLVRTLVVRAVRRQGGEWTTGRVKAVIASHNLTHVYRANIRRLLERLVAEGVLECHETPGRRYYIRSEGPRYDVLG